MIMAITIEHRKKSFSTHSPEVSRETAVSSLPSAIRENCGAMLSYRADLLMSRIYPERITSFDIDWRIVMSSAVETSLTVQPSAGMTKYRVPLKIAHRFNGG